MRSGGVGGRPGRSGVTSACLVAKAPLVLAAVGALALGAAVPLLTGKAQTPALVVLVALLLFVAHRVFGSLLLSPVQIVAGGLALLGLLGHLLYRSVADSPGGGAIRLHLTDGRDDDTLLTILVAATVLLLFALLTAVVVGRPRQTGAPLVMSALDTGRLNLIAAVTPVPLVVLVLGYGPGPLLRRDVYIGSHVGQDPVAAAGTTLSVAAVAALGYLWGARHLRPGVAVLMVFYALAFLGLGSRRLALLPVLLAVGIYAARPTNRSRLVLLVAVVLAIYLLGLPLELRTQSAHGVLPYLAALPEILQGPHPWAAIGRNILISYPLIGQTAFGISLPPHDVLVSVNPLPGSVVGWYQIAPYHRLNAYTPTAGLGEARNAGWTSLVLLCAAVGTTLAWIDLRCKALLRQGRQVFGLALLMLSGLFLLFLVQYNLRSAIRLLYYAIALDLLAAVLPRRSRTAAGSDGPGLTPVLPTPGRNSRRVPARR